MRSCTVCSVLLLLACGSQESTRSAGISSPAATEAASGTATHMPIGSAKDGGGGTARLCADFEAANCPLPCNLLLGAPYDADKQCLGAELAVACADTSGGCDLSITFAKAPDGRVLRFPSSCIPQGWSEVCLTSNVNRQCAAPSCASFDAAICPEPCSPLLGAPYDAEKHCLGAEIAVACADIAGGCDLSITFARAPDGRVLRFPSSCIPQGWPEVYLTSSVSSVCAGK